MLLLLLLSLYFACQIVGREDKIVSYEGCQLWRVSNDDRTTQKVLQDLEDQNLVSIWENTTRFFDTLVYAERFEEVRSQLQEARLKYEVSVENLQKLIEEDNAKAEEEYDPRRMHPMTWNYYHRVDDIYAFLDYLHLTFNDLCSLVNLGHSYEGRPLKVLRISNGNPNNRAVFVESGIHAHEWIVPAATTYAIKKIIDNYEREPPWVQNTDWYFLPVVNPDGYEYTHTVDRLWRKSRAKYDSCVGVDLNRNFRYNWGGEGSSKDTCHSNFRGRAPFSEPETAAIEKFFTNYKHLNWAGYVSFHSYGQYIVYPAAQKNLQPDSRRLQNVASKTANTIIANGGVPYKTGPMTTTIYEAAGCSSDWAMAALGIKYTFTMELRDTGDYGFLLPPKFITKTGEECLIALRTVAEAAQFVKK